MRLIYIKTQHTGFLNGNISRLLYLAVSVLLLIVCTGCVHEWIYEEPDVPPGPGGENPGQEPEEVVSRRLHLHLQFDTRLDILGIYDYKEGTLKSRSTLEESDKPHDIRYTVNLYPISRSGVSRSSAASYVFTRTGTSPYDETMDLDVPLGDYRVVAWSDFVDEGSKSDKYYNTTDFNEITLMPKGTHYGSNEWREAYTGQSDISILGSAPTFRPDTLSVYETTIDMSRPQARYTFITTDLSRFLEGERRQRTANIGDYRIRFVYPYYMASSYNALTRKPIDSWNGVSYESRIEPLSNDEARIGFDYVFVNGDQTATTVGLEVLDKNGNVLARIPSVNVPLERARHTIVKGEFLTTQAGNAPGINPKFDGEYNIEIK